MTAEKRSKSTEKIGALLLEDGTLWRGIPHGAAATQVGECVFHTAHTGYQEILTDPSYRKQIVVFSQSQMGNQGYHEEDFESTRVWASGAITRDYAETREHWRKKLTLPEVLAREGVPLLAEVDTRRLILHLREKGNLWGVISSETANPKELKEYLKQTSMEGLSLTEEVTTRSTYTWVEPSQHLDASPVKKNNGLKRCVVLDFGVKRQILRYLIDSGFEEVVVVPAKTKPEEVKALRADALFLSNGPGDPAADPEIVENVRKMLPDYPTFGICLGHQILGLALGLKTYKLKFGHHGANHPVKNLVSDQIEITSQNHGFAVAMEGEHPDLIVTHMNLNDQTVEGFRHKRLPIAAIQFHPESAPGPMDSTQIFSDFQNGFQTPVKEAI